jgi:prefoldin subunit 5
MAGRSTENEVLAQQLDHIGNAIEALEARIGEVEAVIPRLETAAQMTARALDEVSSHWDAVYRAMRRAE